MTPPETTTRLQEALFALEAMLHPRGWGGEYDAQPQLWALREGPGGSLRARRFMSPRAWLHPTKPPTVVLHEYARHYAELGVAAKAPASILGWAWSMEAWGVSVDPDTIPTEEILKFWDDTEQRRYWTRPDRVETRWVAGCLLTGEEAAILRRRGHGPGPAPGSTGGHVPEVLRLLCGQPERATPDRRFVNE